MLTPISRHPNDDAPPMTPSRVSAGVPRAPLRSVPRKPPSPPTDAADQSTLDMIGSSPLGGDPTLANAPTGLPGFLMGNAAKAAQAIQDLVIAAPGIVPPEVQLWVNNLLQQLPMLVQKMQSQLQPPPQGATGTPQSSVPPNQPMQSPAGSAISTGVGLPAGGAGM